MDRSQHVNLSNYTETNALPSMSASVQYHSNDTVHGIEREHAEK